MNSAVESLYKTILNSDKVLIFTGAGISTLSGIPDFRGVKGVYRKKWHGMEVEEILSIPCFLKHPEYVLFQSGIAGRFPESFGNFRYRA